MIQGCSLTLSPQENQTKELVVTVRLCVLSWRGVKMPKHPNRRKGVLLRPSSPLINRKAFPGCPPLGLPYTRDLNP